eukprot:SAG31_NODE_489_length_14938_cov_5.644113_11_plen_198_part_00
MEICCALCTTPPDPCPISSSICKSSSVATGAALGIGSAGGPRFASVCATPSRDMRRPLLRSANSSASLRAHKDVGRRPQEVRRRTLVRDLGTTHATRSREQRIRSGSTVDAAETHSVNEMGLSGLSVATVRGLRGIVSLHRAMFARLVPIGVALGSRSLPYARSPPHAHGMLRAQHWIRRPPGRTSGGGGGFQSGGG